MKDRFVIDTSALMSYFKGIFGITSSISADSIELIDDAFRLKTYNLIIPSTVFIELFQKFYRNEEMASKINIEIYYRIKSSENMEIQPIDREILENFILIRDVQNRYNFDNHDKQVFAAAMAMSCELITSDRRLIKYNARNHLIPGIRY